jgi:hypothetical protein
MMLKKLTTFEFLKVVSLFLKFEIYCDIFFSAYIFGTGTIYQRLCY